MDFEIIVFMLFMGGLMALAFVGIGVCIGRIDKGIDKRELVGDGADDTYMDERTSDRVSDNGCAEWKKEKTQEIEQLARKLNVKLD